MTRICITGGPRTGKTTLAGEIVCERGLVDPTLIGARVRHTDDLMHLNWSEASHRVARQWLNEPGSWIVEGVAVSRALRKWREQNPDQPPPVDRVIYLRTPHEELTPGQRSMAKGVETVHREIEPWLEAHNVRTEYR